MVSKDAHTERKEWKFYEDRSDISSAILNLITASTIFQLFSVFSVVISPFALFFLSFSLLFQEKWIDISVSLLYPD